VREFQPLRPLAAARKLNLDPITLVRLSVEVGCLPDDLQFDHGILDALTEDGGLENWWGDRPAAQNQDERHALLLSVLEALLLRDLIGDRTTRIDNLSRGLKTSDKALVDRFLLQLEAQGLLVTELSPLGRRIAISSDGAAKIRKLAAGEVPLVIKGPA